MNFHIDRSLPIPIRSQLRGLIEYGIACGELRAGESLPSVRDLADKVGVAPMTVSQVYRDLKDAGLIEAQPGSGTFIADSSRARKAGHPDSLRLRLQIDAVIDEALANGLGAGEIAALVNARLAHRAGLGRRVAVAMVGVFADSTAVYARLIADRLGEAASVAPLTITDIETSEHARGQAAAADVAVTLINRRREVAALLHGPKIVAISFIPSQQTRLALASLDPMSTVGIVSYFEEFLPIMRAGVQRFAPHVTRTPALALERLGPGRTRHEADFIPRCDVVVYASGAEAILDRVAPGARAFEYRHIPDPADIEAIVLPAIREAALSAGPRSLA